MGSLLLYIRVAQQAALAQNMERASVSMMELGDGKN
jgi:hypothetical protein